jgi:small subunit ribosomal protein S18
MARNNDRGGSTARRAPKDNGRRVKKKPCALCKDRVEWVDYKDVAMLRKYMSDRGKIRARRVSGNCTQHQRDVAIAIKTARELVLLPYTQRTTTERPGGRGGRGGRDGGFSGGGGRRGRDEERTLGEDGASTAIPDGTPPLDVAVPAEAPVEAVEVAEVDVVELDSGDEIVVVEPVAEAVVEAGGES